MDIVDRLLSRIKVTPNGCFEWQGCRGSKGYCSISIGGKMLLVHRVSFETFRRPIPPGMLVCHTCDNPCCLNPAHLFLGTHLDNSQDCKEKGRMRRAKGEQHGNSKLTDKQVAQLRYQWKMGASYKVLMERFKVAECTVSGIVTGKTWTHIK